jgi:hypothetical protein
MVELERGHLVPALLDVIPAMSTNALLLDVG